MTAYSGKRIRQNSTKLAQIKRRNKRLAKYGLSVLSFANGNFPLAQYEAERKALREKKASEAK
jgi:hypothetical protein